MERKYSAVFERVTKTGKKLTVNVTGDALSMYGALNHLSSYGWHLVNDIEEVINN